MQRKWNKLGAYMYVEKLRQNVTEKKTKLKTKTSKYLKKQTAADQNIGSHQHRHSRRRRKQSTTYLQKNMLILLSHAQKKSGKK